MVLGYDTAETLFPNMDNALGKEVELEGKVFHVIGVLEKRKNGLNPGANQEDNVAEMPIGTFEKLHPEIDDYWITLKPVSQEAMPRAIDQIEGQLRRRRGVAYNKANDFAIFDYTSGALDLLQEGDPAPGISGDIKFLQKHALSELGHTYFTAHLLVGSGSVTVFDDTTLWGNASGSVALIAREGDLVSPSAGLGSGAEFGQLSSRVVANASGQLAYSSLLAIGSGGITGANNNVILAGLPGSETIVAQEGDLAPGGDPATFNTFAAESINGNGAVAFRAFLKTGFGGTTVNTSNSEGVWANSSGALVLLGREGEPAPCLPDAGTVFSRFEEIIIVDSGEVYFRAYLRGALVSSANDGSIWRYNPTDGEIHLVAREGDIAPGTGNAIIQQIGAFAANNVGGVAHVSRLVSGVGDAILVNNQGLFVDSGSDGLPIMRVRKDDKFTDAGGTELTVTELTLGTVANPVGGVGGYGRVMNDSGAVAIGSSFNLLKSGIYIVPGTAP